MTDTMTQETVAELLQVVVTPTPWRYSFNGATRALYIGRDRFRFHTWCEHCGVDVTPLGSYSEDEWWELYHHFVKDEDAADLLNTQADALV